MPQTKLHKPVLSSNPEENLINNILANQVDYKSIIDNAVIILKDERDPVDINIIIPFRGRKEFIEPLIENLQKAIKYVEGDLKISLTFVEHDNAATNAKMFKKYKDVNYVWISGHTDEFNKSLAYNVGVLVSNESKLLLLHDLDVLIPENAFQLMINTIGEYDLKCIQPYRRRRVLYMSEQLTKEYLEDGKHDVNNFSEDTPGISLQKTFGSKGGSILVERDIFFKVGGLFCEIFSGWSAEDAMFFDTVSELTMIGYCEDIEMYHMYHGPNVRDDQYFSMMETLWEEFKSLDKVARRRIIDIHRELLLNT